MIKYSFDNLEISLKNGRGCSNLKLCFIAAKHYSCPQAHIKLEDYDGAITDCDRALYIEESFVKAYIQKSNALLCKEEFTAAVACLEECVKQCGTVSGVCEAVQHGKWSVGSSAAR